MDSNVDDQYSLILSVSVFVCYFYGNDITFENHHELCYVSVNVGHCNDPGIPMNGSVINLSDSERNVTFDFGAIVKYTCNVGFILTGSPSIQCVVGNSPGESVWNASIPVCEGRHLTI